MSKLAKALTAAAGNAAGESLYVEDVFSTYLYEGNDTGQMISNGIALGSSNAGASADFASGEYLERSSDFTSNSDGKTFTLSAWVFWEDSSVDILRFGESRLMLHPNWVECVLENSSGSKIIDNNISLSSLNPSMSSREGSWVHVLLSLDVNSGSGKLYINDTAVSWTVSIMNNSDIDFTRDTHYIHGDEQTGLSKFSSVYLDYTYRDLATTSNRRIFIDSDGYAVSGLESNNPIIYMPFSSDYAITKNLGTGGDFSIGSGSPSITNNFGPFNDTSLAKGGLVWIKNRDQTDSHVLTDTIRGVGEVLASDSTDAEATNADTTTAFNSNGFNIGADVLVNTDTEDYASWTFRKAEKFFDVVTYTGNGSSGYRQIAHNLGSTPAAVLQKNITAIKNWYVYHKDTAQPSDTDYATHGAYLNLNNTNAKNFSNSAFPKVGTSSGGVTAVYDSSVFTIGEDLNESGKNYVLYLFASDAGGFGDDDENIIKCGSYTGTGSIGLQVDLGFEPQWVLLKAASRSSPWALVDNMRGFLGQNTQVLQANSSSDEFTTGLYNAGSIQCNSTGFSVETNDNSSNGSGENYIYIAIRRPMKTPESGTEVFAIDDASNGLTSGFPVDWFFRRTLSTSSNYAHTRLCGETFLTTDSTDAEQASSPQFDNNTGVYATLNNSAIYGWMFKRATGFFDVVTYKGDGSGAKSFNHNLGVAPELLINKIRSSSDSWYVFVSSLGANQRLKLNEDIASGSSSLWNSTAPTATQFTVASGLNPNSETFVNYLFATLAGVSKVGSYTGTGSNVDVDCGFSAGARFILIKRTDSTGDWYVWDSFRGIVAGNDPYLLLNSTAAQVTNTDYIDPLNAGFTVTSSASSTVNVSSGTYIFLAIAQEL